MKTDNSGFSLMEVLVCVAVLAIICVPIMRGFTTAAWYNNKAYETQSITAFMQQVTETVQHENKEVFQQTVIAAGGAVSYEVNEVQQHKFPEISPGDIYPEELFTTTTCEQENITIGGEKYKLTVEYNPLAYSEKKAASLVPLESGAEDTNVFTSADVGAVDGMKYAVIADEMNRYEGRESTGSAVLYNLLAQMTEAERESAGLTETDLLNKLYLNTGKQINVTVLQHGTSVTINCDIVYECVWPRTMTAAYNVYRAVFELEENQDAAGGFVSWNRGGRIYLFARAWQEQGYSTADMPRYNRIAIENRTDSSTPPLEFYLVRGYYSEPDLSDPTGIAVINKKGLQFDEVKVDGSVYAQMSSPNVLTGEFSTGRTKLHSNIKGQLTGRQLMSADFEATVGMERAKLRCYEVTMTLTDQTSGEVAARIVSTKEVRE